MAIELSENTKSDIHSLTSLCSSIFNFLELAVGINRNLFSKWVFTFQNKKTQIMVQLSFLKNMIINSPEENRKEERSVYNKLEAMGDEE